MHTPNVENGPSLVEAIAANLVILRARRGITQRALANRCNLSESDLSSIEQARGETAISLIAKIADGLHTSITELTVSYGTHNPGEDQGADSAGHVLYEDFIDAWSLINAVDEAGRHSPDRYPNTARPTVEY